MRIDRIIPVKLVVKVFQYPMNSSTECWRYVIEDTANLDEAGVLESHRKWIRVVVKRGPDYCEGDFVRFYYQKDYVGEYMDFRPGEFIHNSSSYKLWSVRFLNENAPLLNTNTVVELYQHWNYGGQKRTLVTNEPSLSNMDFNDETTSIRISKRPGSAGETVDFFEHDYYQGGILQPGSFSDDISIPGIDGQPYFFNDRISSVRISRQIHVQKHNKESRRPHNAGKDSIKAVQK